MLKNLVAFFIAALILLFCNVASASRSLQVVLYCAAPNAACDMAQTRLESVRARFTVVRAWESDDNYEEYSIVVDTYGLNPNSAAPITVIEDSVIVGTDSIVGVYNLIRRNR